MGEDLWTKPFRRFWRGWEAGGGRVLEVFETVADLYGCTPI
jgi:hypothetical protein